MNFSQMHDRLRVELLRRIQRGSLTISLLARQTGYGSSHLSSFLRHRRKLSLEAMDRILHAQHMSAEDLLPRAAFRAPEVASSCEVPIVSRHVALHESMIRPPAVQTTFQVPPAVLQSLEACASAQRRRWHRFVALEITEEEALPMAPIIQPQALVLIDRHYTSLYPYRKDRRNIYAVRDDGHLKLRYAEYQRGRLVVQPYNLNYPIELMEVRHGESPSDLIAGRVAAVFNPM